MSYCVALVVAFAVDQYWSKAMGMSNGVVTWLVKMQNIKKFPNDMKLFVSCIMCNDIYPGLCLNFELQAKGYEVGQGL